MRHLQCGAEACRLALQEGMCLELPPELVRLLGEDDRKARAQAKRNCVNHFVWHTNRFAC